jgi:MerR family transcriptional regulator, mercuric resistance operon regulatory protein
MERTGRIAIGAVSKHTGINVETIRFYERAGLLPAPARSSGGYRLYGTDHVKRLSFIRRARVLGFSLAEVRRLLSPCGSETTALCRRARRRGGAPRGGEGKDRRPSPDGTGSEGNDRSV